MQSLKKSIQSSAFETAPVKSFQAHVKEQITTRWQGLSVFQPESPNTVLIAAALDLRFRKHKFLSAVNVLKVQSTVKTMALAAKKKMRQPNLSENGASNTAQDNPVTHAKGGASFLDNTQGASSDSSASVEEDDEPQMPK